MWFVSPSPVPAPVLLAATAERCSAAVVEGVVVVVAVVVVAVVAVVVVVSSSAAARAIVHMRVFVPAVHPIGPLGYWAIGLLGYWAIGLLGYWAIRLLGYWAIGLLGYWAIELLGYWAIGHASVLGIGHWALGIGRAFEARLGACIVVEVHHRIWIHALRSGLHRAEAQRGDAPSGGSGLRLGHASHMHP